MNESTQSAIAAACGGLPGGCRHAPATEEQLLEFERNFGAIPDDYRWFLKACGGGVCGSEWIDGIEALPETHRKFQEESALGGWTMLGVFVIGRDASGNPFGIEASTGRILVEDHDFGGIHEKSASFEKLLLKGFDLTSSEAAGR